MHDEIWGTLYYILVALSAMYQCGTWGSLREASVNIVPIPFSFTTLCKKKKENHIIDLQHCVHHEECRPRFSPLLCISSFVKTKLFLSMEASMYAICFPSDIKVLYYFSFSNKYLFLPSICCLFNPLSSPHHIATL